MGRQLALPPNLPPRVISREAAAAYVSVSPNTFDLMVKKGLMPPAKLLFGKRRGWDVRALDAAVDILPLEGPDLTDFGWEDDDATKATSIC
jgi:hypothetical protein